MTRRRRRSETCRQTTRWYAYTGGCSWWDLSFSRIGVPPLFAAVQADAGRPRCCRFLVPAFERCASPGVAPS
eukprot:199683-Chlamydomonas_euryale.AAC.1